MRGRRLGQGWVAGDRFPLIGNWCGMGVSVAVCNGGEGRETGRGGGRAELDGWREGGGRVIILGSPQRTAPGGEGGRSSKTKKKTGRTVRSETERDCGRRGWEGESWRGDSDPGTDENMFPLPSFFRRAMLPRFDVALPHVVVSICFLFMFGRCIVLATSLSSWACEPQPGHVVAIHVLSCVCFAVALNVPCLVPRLRYSPRPLGHVRRWRAGATCHALVVVLQGLRNTITL